MLNPNDGRKIKRREKKKKTLRNKQKTDCNGRLKLNQINNYIKYK